MPNASPLCLLVPSSKVAAPEVHARERAEDPAGDANASSWRPGQCPEEPHDWRRDVNLDHVRDDALRHDIIAMLEEHCSMWSGKLGELKATEHVIDVPEGTKPIRAQPYRMGPDRRASIEAEISRMLELGVIEPTSAEWASPIVIAPKKDGSTRFCVDYRRLNAVAYDFVIDCRPTRVHQGPDAPSRVPTTGLDDTLYPEEVPCLVNDHHQPGSKSREEEELNELEPWDPRYAVGADPLRGCMVEARDEHAHCAEPISLDELIREQKGDAFCVEVRARLSTAKETVFSEDEPFWDIVPSEPEVRDANEPEPEPDPRFEDASEVEYVIDKLLDHRVVNEEHQFLVKWFGYANPTWEPEASLPPALVSRFVKRRSRGPQRTAARRRRRWDDRPPSPESVRRSPRLRARRAA